MDGSGVRVETRPTCWGSCGTGRWSRQGGRCLGRRGWWWLSHTGTEPGLTSPVAHTHMNRYYILKRLDVVWWTLLCPTGSLAILWVQRAWRKRPGCVERSWKLKWVKSWGVGSVHVKLFKSTTTKYKTTKKCGDTCQVSSNKLIQRTITCTVCLRTQCCAYSPRVIENRPFNNLLVINFYCSTIKPNKSQCKILTDHTKVIIYLDTSLKCRLKYSQSLGLCNEGKTDKQVSPPKNVCCKWGSTSRENLPAPSTIGNTLDSMAKA